MVEPGDILAFRKLFQSSAGPVDYEPYIVTKCVRREYQKHYEVIPYNDVTRPVHWVLLYENGRFYSQANFLPEPLERVDVTLKPTSSAMGQIYEYEEMGIEVNSR